jgi:hypothetical protein
LVFTIYQLTFTGNAQAIEGGEVASNSSLVVARVVGSATTKSPDCTLAMITSRILVSAGHCFAAKNSQDGSLQYPIDKMWVIAPGMRTTDNDGSTAIPIAKVVLVPGYANFFDGTKNDTRGQRDDIAFIFLDTELIPGYKIDVATAEDVARIKTEGRLLEFYGYGMQTSLGADNRPHTIKLAARSLGSASYLNHAADDWKTITATAPAGKGVCGGDSGGPIYADFDGNRKLVANIVSGGSCNPVPQASIPMGTLIYPYLDFMNREYAKFIEDEKVRVQTTLAQKAQAEAEKAQAELQARATEVALQSYISLAKAKGTYYQDDSCHADRTRAIFQIQVKDLWQNFKEAEGWVINSNCPTATPRQPWITAELDSKTKFRWKVSADGWIDDWYSKVGISAITQADKLAMEKAAQVWKAKEEAEAKSKAEATRKKTTITCTRGKIVKKITAINPKCPKGYKKR